MPYSQYQGLRSVYSNLSEQTVLGQPAGGWNCRIPPGTVYRVAGGSGTSSLLLITKSTVFSTKGTFEHVFYEVCGLVGREVAVHERGQYSLIRTFASHHGPPSRNRVGREFGDHGLCPP
jgi:hypothetical protein